MRERFRLEEGVGAPILRPMSSHSQTEAREHLSDLIDRALAGENVVITRDGRPVVKIRPVEAEAVAPVLTQAGIDWIVAHRMRVAPGGPNAAELVREMRDEGY